MKKSLAETTLDKINSLMTNYEGTDCEEIKNFKEWLEKSKNTIKRKSPDGFNNMMLDRAATKFRGWTTEMFKSHIEKLTNVFKRSQEMTEEEFEKIDQINKKAVQKRLKTMQDNCLKKKELDAMFTQAVHDGEIDISDVLDDVELN